MDILKRDLAPIPDAAWDEINDEASDIFKSVLSARKFVDVDGPKGLDYGAVHTGRIEVASKSNNDDVKFGINQVMPLVENRRYFTLDIWELDNAARGAEDIDLSNMEKAAREIASFEERSIFYGLEQTDIGGIKHHCEHESVNLPKKSQNLLNTLSGQLTVFARNGIEGPYSLIVNEDVWERLVEQIDGYPLYKQVKNIIGGSIILSPFIEEAFLVSERGGDFRLTIGQDLSIGYSYHNKEEVELYFTETFTFQCFEPEAVLILTESEG